MVTKPSPSRKRATSNPPKPKQAAPRQIPKTNLPAATKHQQRLLDIFSHSLSSALTAPNLSARLQRIKQALFDRDFAAAFQTNGDDDDGLLEAYAARWSPTRALCYAAVFRVVDEHLRQAPMRMVSIGGCAAEEVAFASHLFEKGIQGSLTLVDSAPWAHVVSLVQAGLTMPPPLSKYASAAVKEANMALLEPDQLSIEVLQRDVLSMDAQELCHTIGEKPVLVTLMFTLNELYAVGGIGKTTALLRTLGDILPHGSCLLVVDSPGSYSEAAVGKGEGKKRYPMQWLLNHTLMETRMATGSWERIMASDSAWFRIPEGLTYLIPLENMRYQMHLYQRLRE